MKILRVLNVGEFLESGDLYFSGRERKWVPVMDSWVSSNVCYHSAQGYARPMEVPDEISVNDSPTVKKNYKSMNEPDDMSKKCENLNTSAWRLLSESEPIQAEDWHIEYAVGSTGLEKHQHYIDERDKRIGKRLSDLTWLSQVRRKITLPAPLKPISFKEQMPEEGQRIFVYDKSDSSWWSANNYQRAKYSSDDYAYWLPQDALPVPTAEKSLADELEELAQSCAFTTKSHSLLMRAAKELRK
jgi:hypothetical protein